MLFNSVAFAIFLPIVFIIYWLLPHKARWVLMLVASYYFYMSWNAAYVFLIFFTTVISYVAARALEKAENQKRKKKILAGTAVACLGILLFFKYFNFVSESVTAAFRLFAIPINPILLKLLLPVGISFYTFQTLSYVIDVYRGDIKAERHFGYYATFISFFPQLVAGPIERAGNLLPQIKAKHRFHYEQASYGLKLMAWGYFKKIVIADALSQFTSKVYDAPQKFSGFSFVLAAVFFALQIYCDFSGYSDIAIGTAKLFGINLMTNFKSPYFSQSIKEFWSRWHISLSTWLKDYIYIPLGGSRVGKTRHIFNLLITFFISGLWHGANWTFVIWGGIHGLGQVFENAITSKGKVTLKSHEAARALRVLLVFAFVSLSWIFFASKSLSDAAYMISHMFRGISSPITYLYHGFFDIGLGKLNLVFLVLPIIILMIYDYVSLKTDVIGKISSTKAVVRWAVYIILTVWVIMAIPVNSQTEFIYFQF